MGLGEKWQNVGERKFNGLFWGHLSCADIYVSAIAEGWFHTCAATIDGSLLCWGENNYGQLGLGSSDHQENIPMLVSLEAGKRMQGQQKEGLCRRKPYVLLIWEIDETQHSERIKWCRQRTINKCEPEFQYVRISPLAFGMPPLSRRCSTLCHKICKIFSIFSSLQVSWSNISLPDTGTHAL